MTDQLQSSKVLVCREWPLLLRTGTGGYYHYVNSRAGEVGRNAYCIRWLLGMPGLTVESVVEPFGGVGVFATVVQGVCRPRAHYLYDLDNDCLAQLCGAFAGRRGVYIARGDAKETIGGQQADLYLLDFPSPFTALHFSDWGEQWQQMTSRRPGAIVWMDSASFGLQWHAERYGNFYGEPVSNPRSYVRATSNFLERNYGYAIRRATVTRGCFYMLATPGPVSEFLLHKFTTAGRALVSV